MSEKKGTVDTWAAVVQAVIAVVGACYVGLEYRRHTEERVEHAWELLSHSSGQTSPAARMALVDLADARQDLSYVKLDEMGLSGLTLVDAHLKNARFDKADLDEAVLDGHLGGAGLRCARVDGLVLTNTDRDAVDLRGAHWDGAAAKPPAWRGKLLATRSEDLQMLEKTFGIPLPGELAVARALENNPDVEFAPRLPDCLFQRLQVFGKSQDDLCGSPDHIHWDGGWCAGG